VTSPKKGVRHVPLGGLPVWTIVATLTLIAVAAVVLTVVLVQRNVERGAATHILPNMFASRLDFGVPTNAPRDLTVNDFDGDGINDVATANFGSISTFFGEGNGTYVHSADYASSANHIVSVDLDGDTDVDVVTS
jgi:hypothetical protein